MLYFEVIVDDQFVVLIYEWICLLNKEVEYVNYLFIKMGRVIKNVEVIGKGVKMFLNYMVVDN